jgi:two-component system sensor histidine kinase KdpD
MFVKSSTHRRTSSVLLLAFYTLAFILTALTTAALHVLRGVINPSVVALLYLAPVGISTALWGLGPGILAAFAGFLAFNYFFIEPYYSLTVRHTQDLLALVVFLGTAVVLNQLIGRARRNLTNAIAREHEAVHLYEATTLLAGLHDDQSIVRAIAEKTMETFRADRVEVVVEAQAGQSPIFFRLPGRDQLAETAEMTALLPLETARGLLGEVRLWRERGSLEPSEERLLRAFASQSALALERSRLLQADTRARVLGESDRLKTSLLSSVSHELRTPLATIKAAASSLRSGAVEWDSEARPELLAVIEEETDHLNQLVGNLLNMSRIEAGALKPERKWNALEEIVAGVVHRFDQRRALDGGDRRAIGVDIPEELPLVPVDYVLMEQVFANLLDNSFKYSPANTDITISARQIEANKVLVEVRNRGPRVPEEQLSRIFDKFYRPNDSDRVTGSGLGLSICKGIVEAHGGQIWAENLAEGFAFKFSLPLVFTS